MKVITSFIAALLVLSACGIRQTEVQDGYSHLRNVPAIKPKFSETLPVSYNFYAVSDLAAVCYVQVNPRDLLSKRDSVDNWSRIAQFEILIKKNALSKDIIFQSEKRWIFEGEVPFTDSFRIEIPKNEDLWCEITYSDLNKHTYFQEQRWWIREKKTLLQQHFLLLDPSGQKPLINPYCNGDTLEIQSDYFSNAFLLAAQYNNLDKPALSPFAFGIAEPDFQRPDSMYSIQFAGNRTEIPLKSGYLLLRSETNRDQVAGFFTYPKNELEAACESMAYISSAAEVEKLKNPEQAAATFEGFWIKAAGKDKAKAVKLRTEFMRRVNYSNLHFSSYKSGCLTDRGMIYIVFGEPERIRKEGFQEVWTYRTSGADHTSFVFYYDQSQMAPNNCYLERGTHYKSVYYLAVENWRNGFISDYE